MNDRSEMPSVSGNMPDVYDRTLDSLTTQQAVTSTRPTTIRTVPVFGIGGTLSYIVQTFRVAGDVEEDETTGVVKRGPATFTVALEVAQGEQLRRIVLPNDVLDIIIRQRDSLTTSALRRSAKATATARKAAGWKPNFQKKGGRAKK
jgi:hypothetical protein